MKPTQTTQQARELLEFIGERATLTRVGVLSLLLDAEVALSHQELEQCATKNGAKYDRVTLYRVLDWLVEKNIAHKILGIDRSWRYNASSNTANKSERYHAHFHCTRCHQIYCLEKLHTSLLPDFPSNYQIEEVELKGCCPNCTTRSE